MEKVCVTVSMEEERLKALEFALKKKNSSVQRRMDDALRQLYEKEVRQFPFLPPFHRKTVLIAGIFLQYGRFCPILYLRHTKSKRIGLR